MSRIIQPPDIKGHPWLVRDADTGTLLAQVALERDARLLAEVETVLSVIAGVMLDYELSPHIYNKAQNLYDRIVGDK